jgi:hypothetical protein
MILSGCFAASAQTNQIAQLLTTNQPGQYRLEPPWIGESKVTVATGVFANHPTTPAPAPQNLRFDLFSFFDKPSVWHHGPRVISQSYGRTTNGWQHGNLHSHLLLFPTDAQFTEARTASSLTNLLGPSQGFTDGWGDSTARYFSAYWSFFRLKDDTSVETLDVSCSITSTNGQPEFYVDGIKIRRGTARQVR